jgi:cell division control protein 6
VGVINKQMGVELDKIFEAFDNNGIFKNKSLLQNSYQPEDIPHRSKQIKLIASILAPILRGDRTSNLFLYGKTGTGKTLSIQYVREELMNRVKKEADFKLKIEYLNCKLKKVSDTEYRILAELTNRLLKKSSLSEKEKKDLFVPDTGLPTDSVYKRFIDTIDSEKQTIVLILDEIDQTTKKISDDFLYNLTRLNSELSKSQICLVGISNNLTFLDELDPRVKSSLSEEEIVFPPYNALQLQDILTKRADEVFKEGVMQDGVIAKCAALAAREHGDARRALDLLRIAGELAERDNSKKIFLKYIDEANDKIERDKILDVVRTEPKQFQIVLSSIIQLSEKNPQGHLFTGEVYNYYREICIKNKLEILTQRRVSDIIQEFDMLGIITVNVISKGRGGRMREIKLAITKDIIEKVKQIIAESLTYT